MAFLALFLTIFNEKNIIFSPENFPEKLSGLSVKGGGTPLSAKGFLAKLFSVKGVGGGVPP